MFMNSWMINAQELTFPNDSINRVCYTMQIDINKAYVSGVLILVKDGNIIKSSMINEFGLSMMDFIYNLQKDKVELKYVTKALNKWYIKRLLKKDLKEIMHIMQTGGTEYDNSKRKLKYYFNLLVQ